LIDEGVSQQTVALQFGMVKLTIENINQKNRDEVLGTEM
jgi:hypothetical protein